MKFLFHLCCAPCAEFPLSQFLEALDLLPPEADAPLLYFFNPNIHPFEEWKRRLASAETLAAIRGLPLIVEGGCYPERWRVFEKEALASSSIREIEAPTRSSIRAGKSLTSGSELESQAPTSHPTQSRCAFCYAWRLEEAARAAQALGLSYFTSSLLYSPYQDRALIVPAGEKAGLRHGVTFLPFDWRYAYREGQELAKNHGLYRQKYCGCYLSHEEARKGQMEGRQGPVLSPAQA